MLNFRFRASRPRRPLTAIGAKRPSMALLRERRSNQAVPERNGEPIYRVAPCRRWLVAGLLPVAQTQIADFIAGGGGVCVVACGVWKGGVLKGCFNRDR